MAESQLDRCEREYETAVNNLIDAVKRTDALDRRRVAKQFVADLLVALTNQLNALIGGLPTSPREDLGKARVKALEEWHEASLQLDASLTRLRVAGQDVTLWQAVHERSLRARAQTAADYWRVEKGR